jgi:arginine/lysine/ornithine decarboxylase
VVAADVVVDDRNAHKSSEQADTMTHAVPVYMLPTRNRYGITNSTYDGLLYHVPTVEKTLGTHVDRIHFDEAWYGYAALDPIYHERHAMHRGVRGDGPTTFATQSTHKLLAALSQASYIHVRNGRDSITMPRMNEAFVMHASIVAEKTQDFSILLLFPMGTTKGKWGSLLTTLFDFKRDDDAYAPLSRALPTLAAACPDAYAGMGLAGLAGKMHETVRRSGQMDALQAAFGTLPTPVMQNSDAFAHVVRGTVKPVRLDEAAGRVSALGIVPYPPGIPLLMPGEALGAADGSHMANLEALQEFDRSFRGFEHDLHRVEHEGGDYVLTVVDGRDGV